MSLESADIEAIARAVSQGVREGTAKATGVGSTFNFNVKNIEELDDEIKQFTKNLKSQQGAYKSLTGFLKGNETQIEDLSSSMKSFDREIRDAAKELKNATTEKERADAAEKKSKFESARTSYFVSGTFRSLGAGALNLAAGLIGAGKTMLMGAVEFVEGIASNKSGNDLYTAAMLNQIEVTRQTTVATAKFMQVIGEIGAAAMLLPGIGIIGRIIAGLASLVGLAGAGMETTADLSAKLAEKGLQISNAMLNELKDAYASISSVGGTLTKGMTGLFNLSMGAGMRNIKDFADALKESKDNIYMMGISFESAAGIMSRVSSRLRGTKLGEQLDLLGISVKEQAELGLETAMRLKLAGDARYNDDKYVSEQTVEYAKNLRSLNALTGGQAREALKKAQLEAQEAGFRAAAGAAGKKSLDVATGQLSVINSIGNDTLKKLYLQYVQTGEISDAGAQIAFDSSAKLREAMETMRQQFLDGTISQEEATEYAVSSIKKIAEDQDELLQSGFGQAMVQVNRLKDGHQVSADQVKFYNDINLARIKVADGVFLQEKKNADEAAKNKSPLDQAVKDLTENTEKVGVAIKKELFPAIIEFTKLLGTEAQLGLAFADALAAVREQILKLRGIGGPAKPMVNGEQSSQIGAGVMKPAGTVSAPTTAQANAASSAAQAHASASAEIAKKNPSIQNKIQAAMAAQQASRLKLLENSPTARNANAQNSALGLPTDTNPMASATPTDTNPLDHIIFGTRGADSGRDRFDNLDPDVKSAFLNMVNQYVQQNPSAMIRFVSGQRTWAEQLALNIKSMFTGKPTAEPGKSKHESRRAIDIDADSWRAMGPLLKQNGFGTVPNDTGHIEMETGGVIQGSRDGTDVTLAENNKSELVSPLVNGMMPGMKQLIDRVDTLISLTKSQNTTQGKMLRAVA
jgi:hypothetical protein